MLGARLIGTCCAAGFAAAAVFTKQQPGITDDHLIFLGLIFACLAITTAILPARLRSGALLLASLALGLTIVEATATLLETKVAATTGFGGVGNIPIVGWDNGPAGTLPFKRMNLQTGLPIFDVTTTIDADRDRLTKSTSSGRGIVFLGDSLTFGYGVNDPETMPQRFADLLDRRQKVVNVSVSGYSPSQVLAQLQFGLKDKVIGKDPLAFVMLTGAFHVARTACKESFSIRAPRYEKQDGHVAYVGACADGATAGFRRFLEKTATYRVFVKPLRIRINHRDVETFIEVVAETARTAKAKYGVEMLVPYVGGPVSTPKSLQHAQMKVLPIWAYLPGTGYTDDQIIAELRARGVHVVDMTLRDEAMSGHEIGIPGDGHPTPFAHERRAELTLAALKSMGTPLAGPSAPAAAPKLSAVDGQQDD